MGNSASENTKNAVIQIQTEYPYYNSGHLVRGVVFLHSKHELRHNALCIRIQGEEKCLWYEGSSRNRRRYYGLDEFYNVEFVLEKFDNGVRPGTVAYPFSIELSQNLPGSFQDSVNSQTYIKYQLRAYLADYHKPEETIEATVPLIVREPFRLTENPMDGEMISNPKRFCSRSGQTKLSALLTKNVCFIGQSIQIKVEVNNQACSSRIDKVSISLVQNLFVTANCGAVRTFKRPLYGVEGEGAEAYGKNSYSLMFDIKSDKVHHGTAIGTIVAHFYTIELESMSGGFLCSASDMPYVNSSIYLISKTPKYEPQAPIDGNSYKFQKMQVFKPPVYIFRHNKKLQVMNYDYTAEEY